MKITRWDIITSNVKDFFDSGHSIEDSKKAEDLVIKTIRKNKYKFSGFEHQYCNKCCPVFENDEYFICSQRKWGEIMAKAWNIEDSKNMAYTAFAWNYIEDDKKFP